MLKLHSLPAAAEKFFNENGLDISSALVVMRSDMAFPGRKADTFVVLTAEKLYVAEGVLVHTKGKKGRESYFDCFDKREYSVADMSEPKVEALISTARVTALFGNGNGHNILALGAEMVFKRSGGHVYPSVNHNRRTVRTRQTDDFTVMSISAPPEYGSLHTVCQE